MDHAHHHIDARAATGHSTSTLTLVSLAHGINHAQSALRPLVFPLVLRELNFGYSDLGIMLGVTAAVGGTLQLFAGALGRRLPRHLILGIGNASVGFCFVLVGLAQSFLQFFSWTVLSRVGGSAQHPVGSALLSHHFGRRKLGTALATHFTAGNVGTALIPLFAAILIGFLGWRATTILFAVPGIVVGIMMCVWLKDPAYSRNVQLSKPRSFWQDSSQAIRNRSLRRILIAAVVAAGGSGHGIISNFLPLYLNYNLGMETTTVGIIFTLLSAGGIIGPLLAGRLADRYHPQRILLGSYLFSAVMTLLIPWLGPNFVAVAFVVLILGISAFGTNPILQTLVARTTSDELRDTGFAWFYTATFLASALWSRAIGYLSDWLGLKAAFGTMAVSFVAATLCVVGDRFHELPQLEQRSGEVVLRG